MRALNWHGSFDRALSKSWRAAARLTECCERGAPIADRRDHWAKSPEPAERRECISRTVSRQEYPPLFRCNAGISRRNTLRFREKAQRVLCGSGSPGQLEQRPRFAGGTLPGFSPEALLGPPDLAIPDADGGQDPGGSPPRRANGYGRVRRRWLR